MNRDKSMDGWHVKPARLATIAERVCEKTGISHRAFLSHNRSQRYARPRHLFAWLARETTNQSYPQIGRALQRDHTTIINSHRRAVALREHVPAFRALSNRLLAEFRNST